MGTGPVEVEPLLLLCSTETPDSPDSDGITPEMQLAVEDFRNFLENAVPILIAHPDLRQYVVREGNYRLEEARMQGVCLEDISIGEDCLPTWPGLFWDPDVESLHSVLQSRLMNYQASRDLGNVLRHDLIKKSNRKLDEARRLGFTLEDVRIGDRLLPVWGAVPKLCASPTDMDAGSELADEDIDYSSTASESPQNDSSTVDRDSQGSSYLATVFDTSASTDGYDWTSDTDSNDSDSSDMDTIVMDNHVYPAPEYLDPAAPAHIFHDARVVDAEFGGEGDIVDLEVYVVDEDDDETLTDLPAVELAVDRTGYEHHFDTSEAVDVDLPGVDIRCCSPDVESEDAESEEGADQTVIMFDPTPIFIESDDDEDEEVQPQPMNVDDESDVSEEATDEENENQNGVVFEETEYGFRW
ncbi:hypothetical protein HJFPF1_07752 [Paramyrothecium foliicola]|nr:hypothetical protein HJFPF1_07752 [Paramyrothecium foliicola]